MPSRCIPSNFLTSLQSNTIYLGSSLNTKYSCPDSLCAESGSISRPAKKMSEVLEIIEKNYKDRYVSLSIFSGKYIEEDILEYTIPPNLISIYSDSPKTTFLFGKFIFSNSISIENITMEGSLLSLSNKDIIIKNCSLVLLETLLLENQKNVEFIDSSIFGSIQCKKSLLSITNILYNNCKMESLGNTIHTFELENECSILCKIENSSLLTNFSTGILKSSIKDNSNLMMVIKNSTITDNNSENYSMELRGMGSSNTIFSILSSDCDIKSDYMYHKFIDICNFEYNLENNNIKLSSQMHKKELMNGGLYSSTIKNNKFSYINPNPLNKPLCDISKKNGKTNRVVENNTIEGNTEKGIALVFKSFKDTSFECSTKNNVFSNIGEGDGLKTDGDNSNINAISNGNIFNIPNGIGKIKNFINNSVLNQTIDNVSITAKDGMKLITDDNSRIKHILTSIIYETRQPSDSDAHNIFEGEIDTILTTSILRSSDSEKPLLKLIKGKHNLSNCAFIQEGNGDNLSVNNSRVQCVSSNFNTREGSNIDLNEESLFDLSTSQLSRTGLKPKSMINQGGGTRLELAATNLENNEGHCVENFGDNTNVICNAIKTKIKDTYNVIQGYSTDTIKVDSQNGVTQSDSQCLIGSDTVTATTIIDASSSFTAIS